MNLSLRHTNGSDWLLALLFFIGISGLNFLVSQVDFFSILLFWLPVSAAYACLVFSDKTRLLQNPCFYLLLAFILRAISLFSFPALSDDIYRFYWDGILWQNGINPLDHLPGFYMDNGIKVEGLSQDLYAQLNSPEYFTIYPPVLQLFFAFAASFSHSVEEAAMILKLLLLVLDAGTIFLVHGILKMLKLPRHRLFWYALNPLVIIEISGNIHFEGAMVFFMALFIWLILKSRPSLSSGALALAVSSKLLPLMFIPAIIKYLGWKKAIPWLVFFLACLIILFLPFLDARLGGNFGSSFDLYFRKFEFNASFYYLIRQLGFWFTGFNQIGLIGPGMAILATILIFTMALRGRQGNEQLLLNILLYSFCTYLFCSATVHPWYLILPVFLGIFTNFRFPFLWSLLVILSYSHYWDGVFKEHFWLIGIEYGLVFMYLIHELWQLKPIHGQSLME